MKFRSNAEMNMVSTENTVVVFGDIAMPFSCCCRCYFDTGGLLRCFI